MLVDVVTIFPDYLRALDVSLLGKAQERGLLEVRVHDLREVPATSTAPSTTARTAGARAW